MHRHTARGVMSTATCIAIISCTTVAYEQTLASSHSSAPPGSNRFAWLLLSGCLSVELMWSARDAEDAGTAKSRRERRLRQFLRLERLTVAVFLAETQHHAALRGQTKARAGGEARDVFHGQVPGGPLPQESWPAPLPEVAGWQSRVSQHTGDQDRRRRSWVTFARWSCAAYGGTAGGRAPAL